MAVILYSDNINLDIFHYFKNIFESLGSDSIGILSYPRLYPIHENFEPVLNLSHNSLNIKGAYVLDTGMEIIL